MVWQHWYFAWRGKLQVLYERLQVLFMRIYKYQSTCIRPIRLQYLLQLWSKYKYGKNLTAYIYGKYDQPTLVWKFQSTGMYILWCDIHPLNRL